MSKKRGIISRIQTFMDSPKGRTYTNYIYSWGAAIVILGTLFKLTHIAGANLMLFIGMGAEVIVFFFSAFERPFELAEEDRKEERAERRAERGGDGAIIIAGGGGIPGAANIPAGEGGGDSSVAAAAGGVSGTVILGGGGGSSSAAAAGGGVSGTVILGGGGGGSSSAAQTANPELLSDMDKATKEYVEKIGALNETIKRISEQTDALGRNMEEMDTLARNITGINALYETQLRSAGNQVGNIDLVNEETKKMAMQIKELNAMYARMIEAMTTNMHKV